MSRSGCTNPVRLPGVGVHSSPMGVIYSYLSSSCEQYNTYRQVLLISSTLLIGGTPSLYDPHLQVRLITPILMLRSYGFTDLCLVWMQHSNHLLFGRTLSGTSWDSFREFDFCTMSMCSTAYALHFPVVYVQSRANHCAGGSFWMPYRSHAFNVGTSLSPLNQNYDLLSMCLAPVLLVSSWYPESLVSSSTPTNARFAGLAASWEALFLWDSVLFGLTLYKTCQYWKRPVLDKGAKMNLVSLILRDGDIPHLFLHICKGS